MCSTSVTMGGLSFGQSLLQQSAAVSQDNAKRQHDLAQWEATKRRADQEAMVRNNQAVLRYQQLAIQERQSNEQASLDKSEVAREMLRAKAEARLAASEAGAEGNSSDRILTDIGFTEGQKIAAIETSRQNRSAEIRLNRRAAFEEAYVGPSYGVISSKSGLSGLNLAAAAVSGLGAYGAAGGRLNGLSKLFQSNCTPAGTTAGGAYGGICAI